MIPSFSRALLLLLLLLHLHLPQVTAWGDLTNKRVIKDSVNFNDIYHVAVAPNGKSVYACARHADTVMQWDRNTTNGDLSNRKVYTDTKHLDGASCVVVSPDNKHVYVVSYNSQSICTWTHNFETNDLDNRVCKFSTHLYGAETVVVSPDGKNVYATSYVQKAIIIWTRNVETGALTNEVEIRSELQMSGARGLVVSPKGDFVYISCTLAHTLVYWRRNLQDGSLTHMTYLNDRKVCVCVCFFCWFSLCCVVFFGCVVSFFFSVHQSCRSNTYTDGVSAFFFLNIFHVKLTNFLRSVVLSLFSFTFSFTMCTHFCCCWNNNIQKLKGISDLAISFDNKNLYVVSKSLHSIVRYDIQPGMQPLASHPLQIIDTARLVAPTAVVVSPEGSNIYVAASVSRSIVRWDRIADTDVMVGVICLYFFLAFLLSCFQMFSCCTFIILTEFFFPKNFFFLAYFHFFPLFPLSSSPLLFFSLFSLSGGRGLYHGCTQSQRNRKHCHLTRREKCLRSVASSKDAGLL